MVNILINYDCNKSCDFCFQRGVSFNSMSLKDFGKAIDWLDNLEFFQNPEQRRVTLIGGEPTLHPKLGEMINLLESKSIRTIIFSNFVFNKKKLELFDSPIVAGFVGTYNPKSKYSEKEYEIVERNIDELKKKGVEVKLSYNITKNNLDYKYILDACERHGLNTLRFSTAFPNPNHDNEFLGFEDLKRYGARIMAFVREAVNKNIKLDLDCTIPICLLGGTPDEPMKRNIDFFLEHVNTPTLRCNSAIDINPDLSMYYCLPRSEVKIDNILDYNNLREINEELEVQNNDYRDKYLTFRECKNCGYRESGLCQGGCLAMKKEYSYTAVRKRERPNIGVKTWGGIGDGLMATPALAALRKKYPDSEIRVLCNKNHEPILRNNPDIDYFSVSPDESALNEEEVDILFDANYGKLKPSLNYDKHAAKIIGDLLDVEVEDVTPKIILTKEEEEKAKKIVSKYKNPVAIHITSKCSSNQEWSLKNWNKLIEKMKDHTFIQLGLADEPLVEGAVDLRGKTSIREAIAVVKHCKFFVGVDSFLQHAAAAVRTKGIVLFGPSNPEIWGYDNNINLYKKIKCSPCIDELGGEECPHGKKCMKKLSVREVKNSIDKPARNVNKLPFVKLFKL